MNLNRDYVSVGIQAKSENAIVRTAAARDSVTTYQLFRHTISPSLAAMLHALRKVSHVSLLCPLMCRMIVKRMIFIVLMPNLHARGEKGRES